MQLIDGKATAAKIKQEIAQEVEHRVGGEIAQLPAAGMAVLRRLGLHPLQGDHHVPQGDPPGGGVLRLVDSSRRSYDLRTL